MKKNLKLEDFAGVAHGEDLAYLWKHDGHLPGEFAAIGSIEFEMINKMV
jgi:hypothetical protein